MRQVIYPSPKSGVSLGNTWNLVPTLLVGFRAWLSAPAILALDSVTNPVPKLVKTKRAIISFSIKKLLNSYYRVRIFEIPDLGKGHGEVLIVPAALTRS